MACPACNSDRYTSDNAGPCHQCGLPLGVSQADRGLSYTPTIRYSEFAHEAVEGADLSESGDSVVDEPPIVPFLRRFDTRPVAVLTQAGYQAEMVGVSVIGKRGWQAKRRFVDDTHLYDYLVYDAVECTLLFYQYYHGYENLTPFVENVRDGKHMDCEQNMVETYLWLRDDIEAPTEVDGHQASLTSWG